MKALAKLGIFILALAVLGAILSKCGADALAFVSPIEPPPSDESSANVPEPYTSPLPEIPPEWCTPSPGDGQSSANVAQPNEPHVPGWIRMVR